ncbi:MAG TPA: 50S ribosomal protein L10 [Candidatus Magasanikbacteria bacterium]|nr:50S ribosomal protein L10 [Candidatus Magasanikbacteria bacterium]
MPKSKNQKKLVVETLVDVLKESKMVVLTDFKGLKVKEITNLRRELSKNNADCAVVKKTLMNLAFKEAGINFDVKSLPGNIIGLNFDFGENLDTVKIITKFAKTNDKMALLGGVWQNAFISVNDVKVLATLPSREELLSKVVGSIQAPISGFVNILAGNLRGLVQVINAYKDKKATA